MSLRLCAISRDMMTVFFPISAARIPVAAATDVLPVPPFPAKKMILTDELLACYMTDKRQAAVDSIYRIGYCLN
jgi:hypothetical protein